MLDNVQNMLDSLPDDMDGESSTPASNHLIEINPKATKLDNARSEMFHHTRQNCYSYASLIDRTRKQLFLSCAPELKIPMSMTTKSCDV
jgi:hypothetical protein